jgi:hypothetical protein
MSSRLILIKNKCYKGRAKFLNGSRVKGVWISCLLLEG